MYYRKIESDPKAKAQHDDNEKAKARARMDRVSAQARVNRKARKEAAQAAKG